MKTAIVIPCHIPPTIEWITKLGHEALVAGADVIIVDDSDGKLGELPENSQVFDYNKQKEFLGDLYEIFSNLFHKCSACRVFGHILAYSEGYEVIIGLDSDCEVREDFVKLHTEMFEGKFKGSGWQNPLGNIYSEHHWYSRGFPYHLRDWSIVANMGLWEQCLDLNGKDRKNDEPKYTDFPKEVFSPAVAPIPFSGMNFALKREAVPGFLFLPNFKFGEEEFRRIDDIWGGYIFQKLAQKKRQAITFGHPIVDHITEVNPEEDAAEEAAMYKWEEDFIKDVDISMIPFFDIPKELNYQELYRAFIKCFKDLSGKYRPFDNIIPAMDWWVKVWEKYGK